MLQRPESVGAAGGLVESAWRPRSISGKAPCPQPGDVGASQSRSFSGNASCRQGGDGDGTATGIQATATAAAAALLGKGLTLFCGGGGSSGGGDPCGRSIGATPWSAGGSLNSGCGPASVGDGGCGVTIPHGGTSGYCGVGAGSLVGNCVGGGHAMLGGGSSGCAIGNPNGNGGGSFNGCGFGGVAVNSAAMHPGVPLQKMSPSHVSFSRLSSNGGIPCGTCSGCGAANPGEGGYGSPTSCTGDGSCGILSPGGGCCGCRSHGCAGGGCVPNGCCGGCAGNLNGCGCGAANFSASPQAAMLQVASPLLPAVPGHGPTYAGRNLAQAGCGDAMHPWNVPWISPKFTSSDSAEGLVAGKDDGDSPGKCSRFPRHFLINQVEMVHRPPNVMRIATVPLQPVPHPEEQPLLATHPSCDDAAPAQKQDLSEVEPRTSSDDNVQTTLGFTVGELQQMKHAELVPLFKRHAPQDDGDSPGKCSHFPRHFLINQVEMVHRPPNVMGIATVPLQPVPPPEEQLLLATQPSCDDAAAAPKQDLSEVEPRTSSDDNVQTILGFTVGELRQMKHAELVPLFKRHAPHATSIGGLFHRSQTCSPCIFWFKGTCTKGLHCNYCHTWHLGQRKKRIRPSKRTRAIMKGECNPGGEEILEDEQIEESENLDAEIVAESQSGV